MRGPTVRAAAAWILAWAACSAGAAERSWGQLQLQSCWVGRSGSAAGSLPGWCSDAIHVPERRDRPESRRIVLHVAVWPARGVNPAPDPVVFLAGGPGQAATEAAPVLAGAFDVLRRRRDVVLIDQRGTGGSNPRSCASTGSANHEADEDGLVTARCLASLDADPAGYTTAESVEDLAAVLDAWGPGTVNLVGVSYGTRLAQAFAKAYPQRVRALVLDSAVPNDADLLAETGANLDRALEQRWTACRTTPACTAAWGDPAESLRALHEEVVRQPKAVEYRDPRTFALKKGNLDAPTLEAAVRLAAYAPETASLMAWWIGQARQGDASALMGFAALADDELKGVTQNILQRSVLCSEDPPNSPVSDAERRSLLGTGPRDAWNAQCAGWPRGSMDPQLHRPFRSTLPALILQGEWDPATPPDYGRRVAEGLQRSHLVTAPGQGHNVLARGCIPSLVSDFLDDPAKPVNAACVRRLTPLPDAVSVQGASP